MKKIILLAALVAIFPNLGHSRSMLIGANPVGYLIGIGNVHVDFALGEKLALGGEFQFLDEDDDYAFYSVEESGTAYGVRLRYFFNKVFEDSWVITAMGGVAKSDVTVTFNSLSGSSGTSLTSEADGNYFGAMIGYHWQWSTFFMHLGLGFANYAMDVTTNSANTTGVALESSLDGGAALIDFSMGFSF